MSLLERLGQGHLNDAGLARLWTAEPGSDPSAQAHLETCAECRSRFEQFSAWVDDVGAVMRDEADEMLTAERLGAQQAQIARRLEAVDRPARVIAFPKAARAVISGHSHVRRWVTVAAAACLIAGFGLGQAFPMRQAIHKQAIATAPLTAQETVKRVREIVPEAVPINDEELLSDAFARSHVSTLSALDDLTPHARDTVLDRRNKQYK